MNPAPPAKVRASNEFYYVYILRSMRSGLLYLGCTSNLRIRLAEHQSGQSTATKGKGPWELIYYEAYRDRQDAFMREKSLKQFGGAYRQLKMRLSSVLEAVSQREAG